MKPILTRREVVEGTWWLRKTVRLLATIAAGELPPPRPVEEGTNDRAEWVWRDWLADHIERFPVELVPLPQDADLQVKLLLACGRRAGRNVGRLRGDRMFQRTVVDVVRSPVTFLARDVLRIPNLATGRIGALVQHPEGRTWDAVMLWTLAWWGTWAVKVRRDVGLLHWAWPIAGERLAGRLTTEEVWGARRVVIGEL